MRFRLAPMTSDDHKFNFSRNFALLHILEVYNYAIAVARLPLR